MTTFDDFNIDELIDLEENPVDPITPEDEPEELEEELEEPEEPKEADENIKAYYEALKEYKLLDVPDDFEFDGTEEGLEKALEATKNNISQKVIAEVWNALPEDFRPAFQYALQNKVSFKEYLDIFVEQDLDKISTDTPEAQKAILTRYYNETSSFSPEKIKSLISKLEKDDSLEEEAIEALVYLKNLSEEKKTEFLNRKKAEEELSAKQRKERTDELISVIDKTVEDKTRNSKLKSFIFNPIKVNNTDTTSYLYTFQNIMSNPEHFVQLADIMADYDPKTGFKLERIAAQVKTSKNSSFRKSLSEKLDGLPAAKGSVKNANTDFDWDSFLKQ